MEDSGADRASENAARKTPVIYSDQHQRRKSRRHLSSGNYSKPLLDSHNGNNIIGNVHLQLVEPQSPADEDSSGSASTDKLPSAPGAATSLGAALQPQRTSMSTINAGAGVTPGLRRRREREERQKTFLRDQQDASSRAGDLKDKDDVNHSGMHNLEFRLLLQTLQIT